MTLTPRPLRTLTGASALLLTLAGCSLASATPTPGPTPPSTAAASTTSACPEAIARLVDPAATTQTELNAKIDKTKSMINSAQGMARLEAQVRALTRRAVDDRAALRVSVFAGSSATVTDVVVCPTMAAKHNNPKAETAKAKHLAEVAGDAVWAAVRDTKPPAGGEGSSIVGAFAVLAADPPLAPHRDAVVISDGGGPRDDSPADLSGYQSTGLYGVGRVAGRAGTTEATTDLLRSWRTWLNAHHAQHLTVTSQELQ